MKKNNIKGPGGERRMTLRALAKKIQAFAKEHPGEVVSVCSLIVAISALYFTILQAHIARDFQERSTQPMMTFSIYPTEAAVMIYFENSGLGPARLKTFQVWVRGMLQHNWGEALFHLGVGLRHPNGRYSYQVPSVGHFYKPAEGRQAILTVPNGPEADLLVLKIRKGELDMQACYCSLYDRCWIANLRGKDLGASNCFEPTFLFTDFRNGEMKPENQ